MRRVGRDHVHVQTINNILLNICLFAAFPLWPVAQKTFKIWYDNTLASNRVDNV